MVEITIFTDYVLIDGQRVERKAHTSPSQWLNYWERVIKW